MKIFLTIVRVTIALFAAVVLFVTVLNVETPSGTTISTEGAVIDGIALVVLAAVLVWMWVDRRNLA